YWIGKDGMSGIEFHPQAVPSSEFLGIGFGEESMLFPTWITTSSQPGTSGGVGRIFRIVPGEAMQQIDLPDNALMPFLVAQEAALMPGHAIMERPDGTIIIPTDRGLYSWNESGWSVLTDSFTGRFMVETPSGELLVHTR